MEDLIQQCYQLVQTNRLAHAYLLTGDNAAGKAQLTQAIIQALACQHKGEDGRPCQHCDLCLRAKDNLLADVLYIQPDGQWIRVDQIRQLKDWMSTSPLEVKFKLAVIEQADSMNPSSSNALLTLLEEPLDNVYIILYAQSPSNVLPTIKSRVQVVHFQRASLQDRLSYIQQQDIEPSHANIIALLSSDSTEHLIENYDAESMNQWIEVLNYFFRLLVTKDRMAIITVQTHLKPYLSVQQALDSLDYLLLLNHTALMHGKEEAGQLAFQSYFLNELLKKYPLEDRDLLALYDLLLESKQRVSAHVSPQLAFERLSILASQIK